MGNVIIRPNKLGGTIDFSMVAQSKSFLHREIICAKLAGTDMPLPNSDDTQATYDIMQHILSDSEPCFANESASTLRFLIPLSIYLGGREFITRGNLSQRPLCAYDCLTHAKIHVCDNRVITSGEIRGGDIYMRGDISSQFISGLLFVLPVLSQNSNLFLTAPLQSSAYVDITIALLQKYGINIQKTEKGFYIRGKQKYIQPEKNSFIEGDWSYAAFYATANFLGSNITLSGLNDNSLQSDRQILSLLTQNKADMSAVPDLFPALCVAACGKNQTTLLYNAARLRLKESDRISAMASELSKLGAKLCQTHDSLTVYGNARLTGGRVFSHNDHRIAMALTIAACTLCDSEVIIENSECVSKSAPHFFEHIQALGGDIRYIN